MTAKCKSKKIYSYFRTLYFSKKYSSFFHNFGAESDAYNNEFTVDI